MPVFYDLERQELRTFPISWERKSGWGGDEWPVGYGAIGRARDFFPLVFLVCGTVAGFLECYVKEVRFRLSGPARDIRDAIILR